jgi:hypothetical protein
MRDTPRNMLAVHINIWLGATPADPSVSHVKNAEKPAMKVTNR